MNLLPAKIPSAPSFRDSIAERPCPHNSIAPGCGDALPEAMELRGQGRDEMEFPHEENLAVDMKPNFTDDLSPLPAAGHSALRQYRAIYLLNDGDFGQ